MDRRAQLWKALIGQVVMVFVAMSLPLIFNVLTTSLSGAENVLSETLPGEEDITPVSGQLFGQINHIVKIIQGIIIAIGTLGIMFTAVRLIFFDVLGTSSSDVSTRVSFTEREQEQPSVADAVEDLLATSNQSVTSEQNENTSLKPSDTKSQSTVETIPSSKLATRVIREKPDEDSNTTKEEQSSGVKRVIRG